MKKYSGHRRIPDLILLEVQAALDKSRKKQYQKYTSFSVFRCILRIIAGISIFKYINLIILMLDSFFRLSVAVVAHCTVSRDGG